MTHEANKLIEDLVTELKSSVDNIEKSLPTTKNHYGDYMAMLAMFDDNKRKVIALALVRCGANKQGVIDAYNLLLP